jgi:hypothetical protein
MKLIDLYQQDPKSRPDEMVKWTEQYLATMGNINPARIMEGTSVILNQGMLVLQSMNSPNFNVHRIAPDFEGDWKHEDSVEAIAEDAEAFYGIIHTESGEILYVLSIEDKKAKGLFLVDLPSLGRYPIPFGVVLTEDGVGFQDLITGDSLTRDKNAGMFDLMALTFVIALQLRTNDQEYEQEDWTIKKGKTLTKRIKQ